MRSLALLAIAATLAAPTAHARLFWQTYGATAPASGGGCAWNLNSDYFVPRTCDSCRYDLFSPCKSSHTRSPACKYLHPVYGGYCTPFGPWHYVRRDHVYAKRCGCTPLACAYGPWRLKKCRKHGCPAGGGCSAGACLAAGAAGDFGGAWMVHEGMPLANVEPFEGESLGTIAAYARAGMAGGASAVGAATAPAAPGAQVLPSMTLPIPGLNPLPMLPAN